MNFKLRATTLLTITTIFNTARVEAQSAIPVFKKAKTSIFFIRTDRGGGTGFCVGKTGLVATALHVIDGAKSVSVSQSGSSKVISNVGLAAVNSDRDLAILRLSSNPCIPLDLANSDKVQTGQRIIVIGNPLALQDIEASISDGLISGVRHMGEKGSVIQVSAPLSPGNSGGPVLNEDGRVIGVVDFKLTEGELLNFAMPSNEVADLLRTSERQRDLFSWSPREHEAYRGTANQVSTVAQELFSKMAKASNTCQLEDSAWTSTYVSGASRWELKHIEKKSFGSIVEGFTVDSHSGRVVPFTQGHSVKGKWDKIGTKIDVSSLTEDDLIGHLTDNWYCFCPSVTSLWREVSVSNDTFQGSPAFKLRVKEPFFDSAITFWIDKSTYYVIGREFVLRGADRPEVINEIFSDFHLVDGFAISFTTYKKGSGPGVTETVSEFQANKGWPDYVFDPPNRSPAP